MLQRTIKRGVCPSPGPAREKDASLEPNLGMTYKPQRIRDPLHNLIEFPSDSFHDVLWRVIQTSQFQRLRRIKQLGFSELVYPGATHSRFAHSVGVFHTARKLMNVVEQHLKRDQAWDEAKAQAALAATLVHDLGHGPYSHAFEDVGKRFGLSAVHHEKITEQLIRDSEISEAFKPLGSGFASDVAEIIANPGSAKIYGAVVSSQFDADRLDYVQRDRMMTGTQHGVIDFDWLLSNLRVGRIPIGNDEEKAGEIETFVLGPKALHAAEAYLLGLFQLYATVYFHKATRGAEKLFTELLFRVISLARDGSSAKTGLPEMHPLIRFGMQPEDLKTMLALDDAVVAGALVMLSDSKDPVVADFSARIRNRRLFKCIDVREGLNQRLRQRRLAKHNRAAQLKSVRSPKVPAAKPETKVPRLVQDEALDRTCETAEKRLLEFAATENQEAPRVLVDKVERSMYRELDESKGPLNQIMMKSELPQEAPVDVASISQVINAIAPFRVLRVYLDSGEVKAKKRVEEIMNEEAERCRI